MESAALVSGEYSSGDENEDGRAKDVNYDEVGMDMGSSSGSESENQNEDSESKEAHPTVRDGLFTSKEEYEAYQNQFKGVSDDKKNDEERSEYGTNASDNYDNNKMAVSEDIEKDELDCNEHD